MGKAFFRLAMGNLRMGKLRIVGVRNKPVVYGFELSRRMREEFDYIDPAYFDEHRFVRYRKELFDLEDMMPAFPSVWGGGIPSLAEKGYERYVDLTFWSGYCFAVSDDGETVKCARFYFED